MCTIPLQRNNHASSECCIHRAPIFQQASSEDVRKLSAISVPMSYPKGSIIFREGEELDALYIVQEGVIKLSQLTDDGKEHILRFLFPGDFFGQFALLQNKPAYTNAEAIEEAAICKLRSHDFRPLLEETPTLAYSFLLAMSERLQQADEWAGALHILDVEQRLAKLLLHLQEKSRGHNDPIRLPAPKKELAAMIGTTAETLSRKLSQFEAAGWIVRNRREILLTNKEELMELAGVGEDVHRSTGPAGERRYPIGLVI